MILKNNQRDRQKGIKELQKLRQLIYLEANNISFDVSIKTIKSNFLHTRASLVLTKRCLQESVSSQEYEFQWWNDDIKLNDRSH